MEGGAESPDQQPRQESEQQRHHQLLGQRLGARQRLLSTLLTDLPSLRSQQTRHGCAGLLAVDQRGAEGGQRRQIDAKRETTQALTARLSGGDLELVDPKLVSQRSTSGLRSQDLCHGTLEAQSRLG